MNTAPAHFITVFVERTAYRYNIDQIAILLPTEHVLYLHRPTACKIPLLLGLYRRQIEAWLPIFCSIYLKLKCWTAEYEKRKITIRKTHSLETTRIIHQIKRQVHAVKYTHIGKIVLKQLTMSTVLNRYGCSSLNEVPGYFPEKS